MHLFQLSTVPNTLTTLQNILGSFTTSEFREFKRNLSYEYPECFGTLQANCSTRDVAERLMRGFSEDEVLKVTLQLASSTSSSSVIFKNINNS